MWVEHFIVWAIALVAIFVSIFVTDKTSDIPIVTPTVASRIQNLTEEEIESLDEFEFGENDM